jgi:membrane-bound lytic murein transglycosylase B
MPATAVSWAAAGRAVIRGLRHTGRVLRHGPGRTTRALTTWSRNPTGRLAVPSVTVLGLIALATTAGAVVIPTAAPPGVTGTSPAERPRPTIAAGDDAPVAAPPVTSTGNPADEDGNTGIPADVLRGWAQQMSARTGIPVVALQAYGYAELVVAETAPGCQLSWTTLAAIGRVESHHGRTGGATLGADGRAWPAIIGPPLDGQGDRRLIADTDGGEIDGDDVYDRAVGPMQFIPQTWLAEQIDATGDGVADPHNIHDAALAAANYLCRNGRDLSAPDDWWEAVLAYNEVHAYAEEVFTAANEYGRASHG